MTRSCLSAVKQWQVISSREEEGILVDGSFVSDDLLKSASEGFNLVNAISASIIPMLRNTAFDCQPENIEAIEKIILDGQQWMINTFGGAATWHIAPLSRFVVYVNGVTSRLMADNLKLIAGPRSAEFARFADRLLKTEAPIVGNKAFWDYISHFRTNYSVGVKMYSGRINNAECVNREGWHSDIARGPDWFRDRNLLRADGCSTSGSIL